MNNARNPRIIVSMTSHPARIEHVVKVIKLIKEQSLKPDRVILYLAKNDFPNSFKDLPDALIREKKIKNSQFDLQT